MSVFSFHSSEARQRNAYIENVTARSTEFLERPEVIAKMGSIATDLHAIASNIFVPNIRDGVISIPKKYRDSDATPAIPSRTNEQLYTAPGTARPTPAQRKHVYQAFLHLKLESETPEQSLGIVDTKMQTIATGPFTLEKSQGAMVRSERLDVMLNSRQDGTLLPHLLFDGRPLLVLNQDYGNLTLPPLMHEYTHVRQRMQGPVTDFESRKEDAATRELQGHFVGAHVLTPIVEQDASYQLTSLDAAQLRVEYIRQSFADPENPFVLTDDMRNAFRQESNHTYVPRCFL